MLKSILLSLLVVFASSHVVATPNFDFGDIIQFFTGFNDALNIESEQDLDKCTNVPLIKDVTKLIQDLQATSPDPFNLVQDVLNLYNDYNALKENCPETAKAYEQFFSKFVDSIKENTDQTLIVVVENVISHLSAVISDGKSLINDIKAQQYNAAGADLGQIVEVVLAGFL